MAWGEFTRRDDDLEGGGLGEGGLEWWKEVGRVREEGDDVGGGEKEM